MGVAIRAISGFRDSTIRTIVTQYLFSQGQANFPFDGNIGCIFSGLGLLCFGVLETRTRHSRSWILCVARRLQFGLITYGLKLAFLLPIRSTLVCVEPNSGPRVFIAP